MPSVFFFFVLDFTVKNLNSKICPNFNKKIGARGGLRKSTSFVSYVDGRNEKDFQKFCWHGKIYFDFHRRNDYQAPSLFCRCHSCYAIYNSWSWTVIFCDESYQNGYAQQTWWYSERFDVALWHASDEKERIDIKKLAEKVTTSCTYDKTDKTPMSEAYSICIVWRTSASRAKLTCIIMDCDNL